MVSYARGRGPQAVEKASPADIVYNPVVDLTYDGNDRLETVAKVLDGVTFTKTFTRNGSGKITSVSVWVVS